MKRWRTWLLIALTTLVVLAISLHIALGTVSRQRRESALAGLEKPETLTEFEQLMQRAAEAPAAEPDSTATAKPVEASLSVTARFSAYDELFEQLNEALSEGRKPLGFLYDRMREQQWADLEAIVCEHPELMDAIRRTALLGGPMQYVDTADASWATGGTLDHHEWVRHCGMLLAAEARLRSESGDLRGVLESLDAGLRLAEALAEEPLRNAQGVARTVQGFMLGVFEDFVDTRDLSREQISFVLARLDQSRLLESAANSHVADYHHAIGMACDLDQMSVHEFLTQHAEGDSEQFGPQVAVWLARGPLLRPVVDQVVARLGEQANDAERMAGMNPVELVDAVNAYTAGLSEASPLDTMTNTLAARHMMDLLWYIEGEVRIDLTRLAIALEQYHDMTGAYPASLDAIAPFLGGELPIDPFSGESFRYRSDGDTFRLHSLGRDCVDQGGESDDHYAGDIVWQGGGSKSAMKVARAAGAD